MKKLRSRFLPGQVKVGVLLAILGSSIGLSSLGSRVPAVSHHAQQDTVQAADNGCIAMMQALLSDTATPQYKAARECISSLDQTRRAVPRRFVRGDYSRLAEIHMMIPEYHDEQRLPAGPNFLGPKAYAYASPNLDDFTAQWQIEAHGNRGVLVAYVFVDLLPGEIVPLTYRQLHLVAGMNCVWLARQNATGGPSGGWTAKILPATPSPMNRCDPTVASPYTSPLAVRMQQDGGSDFDAYPPVVRFGESAVVSSMLGKPLVGVKCLNAWCEIGAAPFDVRPPIAAIGATTASVRARVKGWHDEQVLTDRTPPNFLFTPIIRAAIVPEDNIETISPARFAAGWQRVATIVFSTPTTGTKYQTWGLRQGRNIVEVRNKAGAWQIQVTPPNGVPRPWRYLHREQHVDVGVPGTARVRWTHADDGFWVPCGMACCHVEG